LKIEKTEIGFFFDQFRRVRAARCPSFPPLSSRWLQIINVSCKKVMVRVARLGRCSFLFRLKQDEKSNGYKNYLSFVSTIQICSKSD
jgi:hypothetical protein